MRRTRHHRRDYILKKERKSMGIMREVTGQQKGRETEATEKKQPTVQGPIPFQERERKLKMQSQSKPNGIGDR
jgi:hypothetical protein